MVWAVPFFEYDAITSLVPIASLFCSYGVHFAWAQFSSSDLTVLRSILARSVEHLYPHFGDGVTRHTAAPRS